MGRKHESVSDPALAKPHAAGTPIQVIQLAEHAQFGTIAHEVRRLWQLHYAMARSGYIELRQHHDRILHLPVEQHGGRTLGASDQPDLTLMVYAAGTQMVINTVLTMQHLCQEIEASLTTQLAGSTLAERIKEVIQLAGLSASTTGPGYSALQEILERRDAIEHPKRQNVFNSHPNNWDRVPLNWFMTERPIKAFETWSEWFGQIIDEWKQHPVNQPRTLTLTVERGKKTTRQAKKPPRTPQ
jgi:hypothetical protein